jgi:hypothetical protein
MASACRLTCHATISSLMVGPTLAQQDTLHSEDVDNEATLKLVSQTTLDDSGLNDIVAFNNVATDSLALQV